MLADRKADGTFFAYGDEINLSEYKLKGYKTIHVTPLKKNNLALIFDAGEHGLPEIVIIDQLSGTKITSIPYLIQFDQRKILLNLSELTHIDQLPNGKIILELKVGTMIWDPEAHSCKEILDKKFKCVVEINSENFALVSDSEINFYKTKILEDQKSSLSSPFAAFINKDSSQKFQSVIGTTDNQFVIIKNNFFQAADNNCQTITYQIQENKITQLHMIEEECTIRFAAFLKSHNALLMAKLIQDDSYTLEKVSCKKSDSFAPTLATLSSYEFSTFHLLPDQSALLIMGEVMNNDIQHPVFYIFNIHDNTMSEQMIHPDIPSKSNLQYTESGHVLYYNRNFRDDPKLKCLIQQKLLEKLLQLSFEKSHPIIHSVTEFPSGVAKIIAGYAGLFSEAFKDIEESKLSIGNGLKFLS